jgi:hypothetical protein
MAEFHLLFKERDSVFLNHLFEVVDSDHDARLSFPEFVEMVTTMCMFDESALVKFAFDTFDADGSGEIGMEEFSTMITELEKTSADFPNAVREALRKFDENRDGQIDLDEFSETHLRFPHLLWPAFRLQFRIQETTLGLNKWVKHQRKVYGKKVRYGRRPCCPLCFCVKRPVLLDEAEQKRKQNTKTTEMIEFNNYRAQLREQRIEARVARRKRRAKRAEIKRLKANGGKPSRGRHSRNGRKASVSKSGLRSISRQKSRSRLSRKRSAAKDSKH